MILALCLPLGGCGSLELYERLLIHGIGVDQTEDGFVVTVRSSLSTEDQGEEFFKVQGSSVLEALNDLSLRTGREPFYAHNYLVVFGKACAEAGLDQCLDFFVRYYNTRPAVQMYLAENTAEEILSAQKGESLLKMSELQQLGESGRYNGKTQSVEILDFVNGVKREGSSPVLPVLKATEDGAEITSTAYFDGFRLKDFLTLEQTRGLLAAEGALEHGEAVVPERGGVTLTLSGEKGKKKVSFDRRGEPEFSLNIQVEADVSAAAGIQGSLEKDLYPRLEEALALQVREEILSALKQAVVKDHCDIFGFGNLLYQRYPGRWREISGDWSELMSRCSYHVDVTAKVQRLEQEAPKGFTQ